MSMNYNTIIVGGGASGLAAAIMIKQNNPSARVLILEHLDRVGKKILQTGNGRCNLTNEFCRVSSFTSNPEGIYPYFTSGSRSFAETVIGAFDADDTMRFFGGLGMLFENKNGCIYPRSGQASSVLDILRFSAADLGVEIRCGYDVRSVTETDRITAKTGAKVQPEQVLSQAHAAPEKAEIQDQPEEAFVQPRRGQSICSEGKHTFLVNGELECRNIIIATGGLASSKNGSDGSGYALAASLGHTVIRPRPALCAVECSDRFTKALAGVRTDARLGLYTGARQLVIETCGNLQFTSYGISGIPVFQMSSEVDRILEEAGPAHRRKDNIFPDKKTGADASAGASGQGLSAPYIKIDLLPEIPENELITFLDGIACKENRLTGILNKKLAEVIDKESMREREKHMALGETYGQRLAPVIKRFKMHPVKVRGFEDAQTTAGGVATDEIDADTMGSKLIDGLYFTGEVVDVNGICGGYNLQWAWASAHAAAAEISRRTS